MATSVFDTWFVRKAAIPLMVAVGIGILLLAVFLRDVEELQAVDEVIEGVFPQVNDEVLAQSTVSIDLIPGYTAELTINGVKIPEAELRRIDALSSIEFQPGEGKVIERLSPDLNCVNALYWPLDQGRSQARSYRWCFNAT